MAWADRQITAGQGLRNISGVRVRNGQYGGVFRRIAGMREVAGILLNPGGGGGISQWEPVARISDPQAGGMHNR